MPHKTVTRLQLSKDNSVRIAAVRWALHKGLLCETQREYAALALIPASSVSRLQCKILPCGKLKALMDDKLQRFNPRSLSLRGLQIRVIGREVAKHC